MAALITGGPKAAIAAGVMTFLKELGWPSKDQFGNWRTSPPSNPNAHAVLSTVIGGLNRYIMVNLQQPHRNDAKKAEAIAVRLLKRSEAIQKESHIRRVSNNCCRFGDKQAKDATLIARGVHASAHL